MLRKFTKVVGRYREGAEHDYPRSVWQKIAEGAGLPLDKFTVEVENNPVAQSSLKGRPTVHRRLGATQ